VKSLSLSMLALCAPLHSHSDNQMGHGDTEDDETNDSEDQRDGYEEEKIKD